MPTALATAGVIAFVAVTVGPLLRLHLRRRGRDSVADDLGALTWPVRAHAAAIALRVVIGPMDGAHWAAPLVGAVLIAAVAWFLVRVGWVLQQALYRRLAIDVTDNLRARTRRTQIELLRRFANVLVTIVAAFVALLSLTPLGSIGPSLVAWAGLIGVVLGMALRAPIENLAAGIVVAVSEPIRIDDVVVVEGEWGRVEQIGLMNVVVHLWDDRRLVLPTSRFVNEGFENWTKQSSQLTGTVLLWVDFGTDIAALRADVERIVASSPLWDGRACVTQAVDMGERGVQVRVLVTASNAGAAFDLRCHVREQLQERLAANPDWLPVVRTEEPALAGLR